MVTVRHEPLFDPDGIIINVIVKANTGSRTIYSDEVGIGGMLQEDSVDDSYSRTATAEEARVAYFEEMRWRGESLGPQESLAKSEQERLGEQSCERDTRRHKAHVNATGEACADQGSPYGADGVGESVDVARSGDCGDVREGTGPPVADEHCIDDCYA